MPSDALEYISNDNTMEITKFGFPIKSTKDVWKYGTIQYDSVISVGNKEYCFLFEDLVGVIINRDFTRASGLSIYDDFNLTKNKLWGTRGRSGAKNLEYKALKELSTPHIVNILRDVPKIDEEYRKYFERRAAPFY